jgi:L-ascorbate metabolism protein UlaG (beta-lactamase superfamily)
MKIHHLRNATMVIESNDHFILVDPMLGPKGSGLPFTVLRFRARRNPIVDLPEQANAILAKVTHCLITHLHPDHLDKDGAHLLASHNIPVVCSELDRNTLKKKGFNIALALDYKKSQPFLGGLITGIRARHGYGFIVATMGNVMGFHLALPGEPSIYLSADTIYTRQVDEALLEHQPDIAVMAAGMAQLDIGQPLLMNERDMLTFIQNAPGKVLANHLEALNHCPNTRTRLNNFLVEHRLLHKVTIPEDGDVVEY